MNSIKENIQKKIIEAMKAGNKEIVEALRFLMARIKNFEIDKKANEGKEVEDNDIINLIRKLVKELNESILAFEKAGRQDLRVKSQKQKEIYSQFLPPELTDEQLEAEIKKIIDANFNLYQQNKKAIIGVVMKELQGKADNQRILKTIHQLLNR